MDTAIDAPPRRRGPKLPELVLSDEERTTLQRWVRRRTSGQALALRCRIVLACAQGASNAEVVKRLGVSRPTVTKWRLRFVAAGWRAWPMSRGQARPAPPATSTALHDTLTPNSGLPGRS